MVRRKKYPLGRKEGKNEERWKKEGKEEGRRKEEGKKGLGKLPQTIAPNSDNNNVTVLIIKKNYWSTLLC